MRAEEIFVLPPREDTVELDSDSEEYSALRQLVDRAQSVFEDGWPNMQQAVPLADAVDDNRFQQLMAAGAFDQTSNNPDLG